MSPRRSARSIAADKTKENTMLKTIAAALLATTLVAGTALAAEPATTSAAPATQTAPAPAAKTAQAVKPTKPVKHAHKSVRKHVVKAGKTHQAKLSKKTHQAKVSKQASKRMTKSVKHADGGHSCA
jgi:hypothetical protein